jgi:hypothetical protein
MIKRPLNARFPDLVLDEIKITTIREKPWPVGVPIMLYRWSGKAYRSKQIDVCAVVVEFTTPIKITRLNEGAMCYSYSTCGDERLARIWTCEGFHSQGEMDDWFMPLIQFGQTVEKHLMRFKLWKP